MEKYQFTRDQLRLIESMKVPFAIYQFLDKRVVTLALSDGFCEMFAYADRAAAYHDMDHDMYKYDHPDDIARISEAALRFATEDVPYDVVYRTRNRHGAGYKVIHATGQHAFTEEGHRLAYVWYTDEGDYQADAPSENRLTQSLNNALREESLIKANYCDYLTGLPNMTYFFDLAEAGKTRIWQEGGCPCFLFIDFSGLKFFNHKHGFAQGDKLIQSFSRLLVQTFGDDHCSHFGQGHFGVFTPEEDLAGKLDQLFEKTKALNGGDSLPIRVGVYSLRMGDAPVSVACDRAKIACDALRGTYASRWNRYNKTLQNKMTQRQYIVDNLDRAIEEKWIQVYYQPIVRAVNGRVCDEEALARWIDPVRGTLSPVDFIPYLEETDLIYKLDLYMVDQVLEKIRMQQEAGLDIVPHSINLSRSDFNRCDIVEEIRRRVDEAGLSRDKITIEITESTLGRDFEFMKTQIARFQALGFPVWMDDFGSGYSSLDVLQSIKFNLLKFDMSFMRKLDQGEAGKIILTELMKMATALGVDTVCEGVETKEQLRFLREIGCSKLQGYYFCKPIPLEALLERYHKGMQIGYENPKEAEYYEGMGRVNLYDFAAIVNENDGAFQNFFNTLPMGVIEISGDKTRFVRSNQSYRDFIKRFFGFSLSYDGSAFTKYGGAFMYNVVKTCCEQGTRAFYDEQMPDGTVVHSFARRIGVNPVNGNVSVAVAVLSITDADEGTTYARIARALAEDYYNIYYVDLNTGRFIEYASPVGGEELAIERHGENFFEACQRDAHRIYSEDRAAFFASFNRENILRELDQQGVFTVTYRLVDTGSPMYVNMKIMRMQPDRQHIIIGISIIDSQMKHQAIWENILKEQDTLTRVMALNEDYLSLYTIDPVTGAYVEYTASDEYETLGFAKTGEDFFKQGIIDGKRTVDPEDLPRYLESFSRSKVLQAVQKDGVYKLQYRLVIKGQSRPVSLKISPFKDHGEKKLFAGVRAWKTRQ